jgi:2-polyprenyl-3-methyl-5-hydroxy-6-metoxy-1,4-benzoquinol methylase
MDDSGVSIYESEDSVFQADGNEGYYLDHESNLANSRLKLSWVTRDLPAGKSLFDAGCSFGHFLKVAGQRYDVTGFDISPMAVAWSREHFQVPSFVGTLYGLPDTLGPFDAVCSWNVIEHLPAPLEALRCLRPLLKPGGLVFLSTPDTGSLVARILGRQWHYLDPVQHINLFSASNLAKALTCCGFEVLRLGSLGHRYRLRYILDRLHYLHRQGHLRAVIAGCRWTLRPFLDRAVYVRLGDVLVVTAVMKDEVPK